MCNPPSFMAMSPPFISFFPQNSTFGNVFLIILLQGNTRELQKLLNLVISNFTYENILFFKKHGGNQTNRIATFGNSVTISGASIWSNSSNALKQDWMKTLHSASSFTSVINVFNSRCGHP